MKSRSAAILALSFLILVGGVSVAPRRAEANLPVIDLGDIFQNTVTAGNSVTQGLASSKTLLNPLFYAISQSIIQSMVQSTVNWINSGFNGSPAYVTDIKGTLQDAADQEAQQFLGQLNSNLSINSPFRDIVAQTVLGNYYMSSSNDGFFLSNPYTLNQYSSDPNGFTNGDISKGGLQAWIAETSDPQNNPFGALTLAEQELNKRIASVQGQIHEELGWGNGFLSWRKCDVQGSSAQDNTQVDMVPVLDANGKPTGQMTQGDTTVTSLTSKQTCLSSHIETPGSVIANQINHSLGLGADSLVNAKEFDEIVNALMAQLMKNVLGNTGLSGLSQGSTASGGNSYFDQSVANNGSAGVAVATDNLQTIESEIAQLQTYQANWQKISAAANAAKTACAQNQTTIDSQIQPVITQAATALGNIPTLLDSLNSVKTQIIQAAAGDSSQQNALFQQATADNMNLLSQMPSQSEQDYAAHQAVDTGDTSPSSLYTQMNQLAANKCGG